jgi:SAM-dependent methyltransferase
MVLEGDALSHDLPEGGFEVITCVATLHHLAREAGLEVALKRLRALLAPGGTLVVLGLHRQPAEAVDYLQYLIARPADLTLGVYKAAVRSFHQQQAVSEESDMPVMDAVESLPELRAAAEALLPGASIKRLLFWRYLLVFTAPLP